MIKLRRAEDRGHARYGWLDTHHTFSFGDYHDPEHVGFRMLRVINDDRVAPGAGFPTHPHRDMEIVTYVLEGALEHRDSMGNGSVIRPGEVQRMSAGTGVLHSEYNHSKEEEVRLLQIWVIPNERNLEPSYEQRQFDRSERTGRLRIVASPDGRDGSVRIHQDASIYTALLREEDEVAHPLAEGRHAWVHVATGSVRLNGIEMKEGDGAAVSDEGSVTLTGGDAEILLFDLA